MIGLHEADKHTRRAEIRNRWDWYGIITLAIIVGLLAILGARCFDRGYGDGVVTEATQ